MKTEIDFHFFVLENGLAPAHLVKHFVTGDTVSLEGQKTQYAMWTGLDFLEEETFVAILELHFCKSILLYCIVTDQL